MEEATEGDKAVIDFVTPSEEDAVSCDGSRGRHEGYSGQQKNYPGKTKNWDRSLISVLHALKIFACSIMPALRTVI